VGPLAVIHFIIGGLAIVSATGNLGAKWAQSTLTLIWVLTYDFTIGPLAYCGFSFSRLENVLTHAGIVGETSSTRLRAKTVAISRNVYYMAVIFSNVISPYMLNPTQWNLQGKTNFVWGPIAALCAVWGYFRLPEMKVKRVCIAFDEQRLTRRAESVVLRARCLVREQGRRSTLQEDGRRVAV
jgi:SP family general alpha glucoside:H+ symporter-like MFS transporter